MRTIKKYSNRRLYDTEASAYINLEALAGLIREGEQVQVVDASSGEDLTHTVLLQVVLETGGLGELFPAGFLHRIIRHSGAKGPQKAVLQQLGVGLQMLEAQMQRFEAQFGWMATGVPKGPTKAEAPRGEPEPEPKAEPKAPEAAPADPGTGDAELDALRARLAALEKRLGG